jgi:hypothetical protein
MPPRCADVNHSGRVTLTDVIAVIRRVGRRYDARYDVNRDGRINVFDVWSTLRRLGRRC